MKRDMDLCREILLKAEAELPERTISDPVYVEWIDLVRKAYPDEQEPEVRFHYYVKLLGQSGLLETTHPPQVRDKKYPLALTWEGHEFLAVSRNPETWETAKERVSGVAGDLIVSVLKDCLLSLVRDPLGL